MQYGAGAPAPAVAGPLGPACQGRVGGESGQRWLPCGLCDPHGSDPLSLRARAPSHGHGLWPRLSQPGCLRVFRLTLQPPSLLSCRCGRLSSQPLSIADPEPCPLSTSSDSVLLCTLGILAFFLQSSRVPPGKLQNDPRHFVFHPAFLFFPLSTTFLVRAPVCGCVLSALYQGAQVGC